GGGGKSWRDEFYGAAVKIANQSSEGDTINACYNLKFAKRLKRYLLPCLPPWTAIKIFESFYKLENYNTQNMFIAANVKEADVKRRMTNSNMKKKFSRKYLLDKVEVCRDLFVKTLGISTKRVNTALIKMRSQDFIDRRGSKSGGKNKCSDEIVSQVRCHINSLPKYKSHYRRSERETEYLMPDMTLDKMYDLYCEHIGEAEKVSKAMYSKLFYKHFNLKRAPLKKDTCNKKRGIKKESINWLQTREIYLKRDSPNSIYFKTEFLGSSVEVNIGRAPVRGRPAVILTEHLVPLWPSGKPVSPAKLADIQSILHLIPEDAQSFYNGVICDDAIEDDIDGLDTFENRLNSMEVDHPHQRTPEPEEISFDVTPNNKCSTPNDSVMNILPSLESKLTEPPLESSVTKTQNIFTVPDSSKIVYDAKYKPAEMSRDENIPADNDWNVREEWGGPNKNAKRKVETGNVLNKKQSKPTSLDDCPEWDFIKHSKTAHAPVLLNGNISGSVRLNNQYLNVNSTCTFNSIFQVVFNALLANKVYFEKLQSSDYPIINLAQRVSEKKKIARTLRPTSSNTNRHSHF
ncbi:hypothetical protein SFRURICE_010435, partial [Spodoptera frugiperda]